jgi:hypothetical protein
VFRSRLIAAVVLAVAVVVVVALARALAGPAPARQIDTGEQPAPSISVDPNGDDSVTSDDPPPSPRVSRGTAGPDAVAYAFASSWADHQNVTSKEWHSRLLPHITASLSKELAATDPEVVPADRVTGNAVVTPLGDQLVEARVATDAGELRLNLITVEGRWLVDSVGWRRS